jgi:hypothetical protein
MMKWYPLIRIAKAVATGTGGLAGATAELALSLYDAACLFGGAQDQNGKFAHLTYVGSAVGALARGRAAMAKNAVIVYTYFSSLQCITSLARHSHRPRVTPPSVWGTLLNFYACASFRF